MGVLGGTQPLVLLHGFAAMARLRFARASSVAVLGVRWATSAAAVMHAAARASWRSILTAALEQGSGSSSKTPTASERSRNSTDLCCTALRAQSCPRVLRGAEDGSCGLHEACACRTHRSKREQGSGEWQNKGKVLLALDSKLRLSLLLNISGRAKEWCLCSSARRW